MARENGVLLTTAEAAALIGDISEDTLRRQINRTGSCFGAPVFRTGATARNIRIPRGRLLQALGMSEPTSETDERA